MSAAQVACQRHREPPPPQKKALTPHTRTPVKNQIWRQTKSQSRDQRTTSHLVYATLFPEGRGLNTRGGAGRAGPRTQTLPPPPGLRPTVSWGVVRVQNRGIGPPLPQQNIGRNRQPPQAQGQREIQHLWVGGRGRAQSKQRATMGVISQNGQGYGASLHKRPQPIRRCHTKSPSPGVRHTKQWPAPQCLHPRWLGLGAGGACTPHDQSKAWLSGKGRGTVADHWRSMTQKRFF